MRIPAALKANAEEPRVYPEYDKVWEDNTLNVVAIFGKAKEDSEGYDSGSMPSAPGKRGGRAWVLRHLGGKHREGENSATVIKATLADGRQVNVRFMIRSVSAARTASGASTT